MRRLLLGLAAILGISTFAVAQGANTAPPDVIKRCETCHGAGGNSITGSTPRLNGQLAGYMIARLQDFLDLTREAPHASEAMNGEAHRVSNDDARQAVADYFSRQQPTSAKPSPQTSLGARIFEDGVPADQVPACQTCHGAHAEGRGAAPRLAGQRADYLRTQLWVLNFSLRESNSMHENADKLNGDQIDALVSYLAGD